MRRIVGRLLAALLIFVAWAAPLAARPLVFPAPDRELMVPVAGGKIYVRINGDIHSGRPPVIFVHGGPGGTHRPFLDALALADQRAVILYDQLDSGRSDHPGIAANWTVGRFVGELESIRAALGIDRWYVDGASWGGTIALEYAARRPAALAGVVLASPLVSTRSWIADANALRATLPLHTQRTISRCETRKRPAKATCDSATAAFNAAFGRREPVIPPAFKGPQNPADRGNNETLYNRMWGSSEFVSTGTLKSYDAEPLLARLDGRHTLFMVGQYDEARPVTAIRFARRVKDAELAVIPGAGHSTLFDRPDETLAVLRAWFNRQDQSAR